MPSDLWENFVGGAGQSRSINIAADTLVNMYVETSRLSTEAKKKTLYGRPGLKALGAPLSGSSGGVGCVGIFDVRNPGLNHTFIWSGSKLYTMLVTTGVSATVGSGILGNGQPLSFAANNTQLAFISGGTFYLWSDGGGLTTPVVPFTVFGTKVGFLDGYFLAMVPSTGLVYFSALEDGTTWDALDFFAKSRTSDTMLDLQVIAGKVWLFGEQDVEIFYDSGDATTPFAAYPGGVLNWGHLGTNTAVIGDRAIWVGQNQQSAPKVIMAALGAEPVALSTPAIDRAIASAANAAAGLWLFPYQQEGHSFVVLTLASTGENWVVDLTEPGYPWHQLAGGSTGSARWRGQCIAVVRGVVVTGDFSQSTDTQMYTLDLDTFTDNGTAILRSRTAPYLAAENQWLFISAIEMGIESGVGLAGSGAGSSPTLSLELSRDSAHTFGTPVTTTMGQQNDFNARAIWRRLGRARADRLVARISSSDPVKQVWGPGLFVRGEPGTGQL